MLRMLFVEVELAPLFAEEVDGRPVWEVFWDCEGLFYC